MGEVLQNSAAGIDNSNSAFMPNFLQSSPPSETPSPALLRSALGEVRFGAFTIEIGDADFRWERTGCG